MVTLRYRSTRLYARLHTRYLADCIFVHINKTGGSSVETALGLPFQHRTAREILADIGPRRWASRFSFAIVRNPWDKVASHYHYRVKTDQTAMGDRHIGFREWVHAAYGDRDPRYYDQPKMFMPQREWICDGAGRIIVDFVGRFETLHEDFRQICERLGRRAELPHLKRSANRDYRSDYDDAAAALVADHFAADIREFGYTFG